jgi:hypothetical protein
MRKLVLAVAVLLPSAGSVARGQVPVWAGFAGDAQHTADSSVASDSLSTIRWETPVDTTIEGSSGPIDIHYGSPVITAANTVIVPVKTSSSGNFEVEGITGSSGAIEWTYGSNYVLPPYGWTPSFSPALTPSNTLYYPGAGGTVFSVADPDSSSPGTPSQIAFFGNSNYQANPSAYNSSVYIDTPITSDSSGDVYFGYRVTGSTPLGTLLSSSGIARITPAGAATYVPISSLTSNAALTSTVMNGAPAISADGTKLYVALSNVNVSSGQPETGATGDLVELNATTLAPLASVALTDPKSGAAAYLPDDGTASVTIGPNGDVYYGVLDDPFNSNNDRGWLLHFSGNLATKDPPAAFGWDDTASVVPAAMVPNYKGSSSYLLMVKYNNYAGHGTGNGVNQIAIVDPTATMTDPISGQTVMDVVESISGVTRDADARDDGFANAVREWCINSAVFDPATDSILANSEDGNLYRWDLATDTFTQVINLTSGVGEAYTPTVIGADGAVYAIQDGVLFSVVPEPASAALLAGGALILTMRRRQKRID